MVRQMHFVSAKQFAVLLVVLLAMWGMGCNGCQPPATVDEPASNLDVNFAVLDITETPSDGKVIAVMQLLKNGTVVQFGSNASATCNGVALTYNVLTTGYAERVPLLAVGGTYNFRYSRNGVNTDVSIPVAPRPVFAAPTVQGATLTRTASFTIHYVAGSGASVRGDASDGTHSQNNGQPDDGTHDGLDVSGFNAGPGTLSLTRNFGSPIPGTGFHSATNKYSTGKTINITWQ